MGPSSSASDDFEIIDSQEASLTPDALAELQAWLQPTDYTAESSEFHRHLSSQAPGTGLWIGETTRFRQWHDSGANGSLWIKGVPGAGKSVIAASMIQHLKVTESAPVLFFFFRYIIAANRTPRSLVRDWLSQLLPHSPRLQASLQPLLDGELDDVADQRLWEHLLIGLSSVERAYCVLDALDEMELAENDDFLQRLNCLSTFQPGSIKVLMTSRPKQYLQSSMRDASIVHINLEDDLVGRDIGLFVSHRLRNAVPNSDQADTRTSLDSIICSRSRGLFLYARLLLDQLIPILRSEQHVDVEHLAESLPVGLEDMYNSMLIRQSQSLGIGRTIQVFLLEYAIHSSRNLRLNELANILAYKFPPSMIPGTPKAIARTACAPLLEIMEDETVQIIHHSFTEFLLGADQATERPRYSNDQFPTLNPIIVHKKLAMDCLDYLQSGVLRPEDQESENGENNGCDGKIEDPHDESKAKRQDSFNYQDARLRHPFLEYAVTNWAYHASKYDVDEKGFFASINNFVDPESADFNTWLSLEDTTRWTSSNTELPSGLHLAAFAGLTHYATSLLDQGQHVDGLDADERTPLLWAAKRGHPEMVRLLLHHGAKPDAEDCHGVKPIHAAAKKNEAVIVKMLLEAGVDPLDPKTCEDNLTRRMLCGQRITKGETAVRYVCEKGYAEVILAMLPFVRPETLEELLCECCRYGKFEAASAVLRNSAVSVNAKFCGATALFLAVLARSVACVQMLLANGADVNSISEWKPVAKIHCGGRRTQTSRTPLHTLVRNWSDGNHKSCHQIFRMLLAAGANLQEKDGNGNTPLLGQFESRRRYSVLAARALLEAGADANAVDPQDDNVLHRFLNWDRDIEILEMLLNHGANINARGKYGSTPLHEAIGNYSHEPTKNNLHEVVIFLLERGALCSIKNDHGSTPLEQAMTTWTCDIETFRILFQACTDQSARERCLWLLGSRKKDERVQWAQELIASGMSLETRDSAGKTVVLTTIRQDDTWKALVQCGARLDVFDKAGRGALHHYVSRDSSPEGLRALIETGLDPHKVDDNGNSLMHLAAEVYEGKPAQASFIEELIRLGLSVNAKNNQGRTPLHIDIEGPKIKSFSAFDDSPIPLLRVFQDSGHELDLDTQDVDGVTPFHLAAMRSELDVFRFLTAGADLSIVSNDGRSALHMACRARESNVIGFLLDKTGKELINKADKFGRTPLHDACTSGLPESVHYLLKHGADINARDTNGLTPLHCCAEFSREQQLWALLSDSNKAAGHSIRDRFRPVHESSRRSARIYGIVNSLVAAGADVLAKDSKKYTPLNSALSYRCEDMVEALQHTALDVQRIWETDPEEGVSEEGDSRDVRLQTLVALNRRGQFSTLAGIPDASIRDALEHPSRYISFLDRREIEWISKNGHVTQEIRKNKKPEASLLHTAAAEGLIEVMECLGELAQLYDNPASVRSSAVEKFGDRYHSISCFQPTLSTACARERPNFEMLEILIVKCGVDVNARGLALKSEWDKVGNSVEGGSALHVLAQAKYWWQLDAIKFLIEKGADINSKNEKGETPLHVASFGELWAPNGSRTVLGPWRHECVQLLLTLGADPNILDDNGFSCLHKAGSSPEVMQTLLDRGADISIGKLSPLFSAIHNQDVPGLKIILDCGVSPNTVDTSKSFHIHYQVKDQERHALFCAAFPSLLNQKTKDSAPLVKVLIERGADLYVPLNDYETLIHYVFEHAEYEFVCAFLDCADRIDFNTRDQLGRTVFQAACNWFKALPGYKHKHWDPKVTAPAIRTLSHGADPLVVDKNGRTALHHLLDNPDMEQDAVRQFLKHPAAKELLCKADGKGFSPLNCAFRTLRPALCEELVAMGADLLELDPNGATALHFIASQYLRVYRQTREGYGHDDEPPTFYEGCLALWKKYLDLGGDINVRDNRGSPPLFWYLSSAYGIHYRQPKDRCCHVENFEKFFADADIHARNGDGETALHIVAQRPEEYIHRRSSYTKENHDKKLFGYLMAKGLDPLAEDNRGRSSLDVAAACGKKEILDLFQFRD